MPIAIFACAGMANWYTMGVMAKGGESAAAGKRGEFAGLLGRLFQLDCADLDFGVYRIMKLKSAVIKERLIDGIGDIAEQALGGVDREARKRRQKALEKAAGEVREDLTPDAINSEGELDAQYRGTNVGKKYLKAREDAKAESAVSAAEMDKIEAELFNHLCRFFDRYYEDGDFMPRRRVSKRGVHSLPYNGEDVHLHWANRGQYYIKSAPQFSSYAFNVAGGRVRFVVRAAPDMPKDNNKGGKRLFFPLMKDAAPRGGEMEIPFEHRPANAKDKIKNGNGNGKAQDEIIARAEEAARKAADKTKNKMLAALLDKADGKDNKDKTLLALHLKRYARGSDSDFFIHRDLRGFLSGALDSYIKTEVLDIGEFAAMDEARIVWNAALVRAMREIGGEIVNFLAQFEDFQKTLWEKKKFVTETNYIVRLGALDDKTRKAVVGAVVKNEKQWKEWKKLGMLGKDAALFAAKQKDKARREWLANNPAAPLDTKHFDETFALQLLAAFDNIDENADGVVIHGDNFQALNLITGKYRGRVKCVYIDPPYNTENDDFIYKDGVPASSWLSMVYDRAVAVKSLLSPDSWSFWTNLDDGQIAEYRLLLNEVFGAAHFSGNVAWKKTSGDNKPPFAFVHDNLLVYGADIGRATPPPQVERQYSNPDNDPRGKWAESDYRSKWNKTERKNLYYGIKQPNTGEIIYPDTHSDSPRVWGCEEETHKENEANKLVWWGRDGLGKEPKKKRFWSEHEGVNIRSVWDDAGTNDNASQLLRDMFGKEVNGRLNPKPWELVRKIGTYALRYGGTIVDYFAGSGTTAHAVINLNREDGGERKFIMVEMGEYFNEVLLPRIKKVMFAPEWKDGKPAHNGNGGDMFEGKGEPRLIKYQRIESYEDALDNIHFDEDAALSDEKDYQARYMLKWESKDCATFANGAALDSPFPYKLRRAKDGKDEYVSADLPETFNYLAGMHLRARRKVRDGEREYLLDFGVMDGKETAIVWRDTQGWEKADYLRDRKFLQGQEWVKSARMVYTNGDNALKGAKSLTPRFKELMFPQG